MKAKMIFITIIFINVNYKNLYGQGGTNEINGGPVNVPSSGIIDGVFIKEHVPTKRLVSTETVREADAVWSKRVWQYIDLREKINHPLYFPIDNYDSQSNWVKNSERWSLWTILKTHILNGDLKVFMTENPYDYTIKDGDQLKYPIEPAPGKNFYTDSIFNKKIFPYFGRLEKESITPLPSLIDGTDSFIMVNNIITYVYPEREKTWLTSQDVIQYHLKEDWFFDKERSVMDVRIIAIAPVVYSKDLDGQITGTEELFWLYFPHCRYVLNNYYAFNEHNDAQWMSYDDLFWKRKFSSVIYKESNVFDRKIETYKNGLDALLEADKIKEEIRTIEHDVWSF